MDDIDTFFVICVDCAFRSSVVNSFTSRFTFFRSWAFSGFLTMVDMMLEAICVSCSDLLEMCLKNIFPLLNLSFYGAIRH